MFISIVLSMSRIGAVDFDTANATISSKDNDERIDFSFTESIASVGVPISAVTSPAATLHAALFNNISAPSKRCSRRSSTEPVDHTPVEPKPPAPRTVSLASVISATRAWVTGAITIWAMRMPREMTKGSSPRLISSTFTSPR